MMPKECCRHEILATVQQITKGEGKGKDYNGEDRQRRDAALARKLDIKRETVRKRGQRKEEEEEEEHADPRRLEEQIRGRAKLRESLRARRQLKMKTCHTTFLAWWEDGDLSERGVPQTTTRVEGWRGSWTGSVAHVMGNVEASGCKVEETAEPEEKNVNVGEMNLHLPAENEHTGKSQYIRCTVHAAKVAKPLFSGGKICDNGIDVLCYAVTIDAKTGKELTRHPRRENGTYRFQAKLGAPEHGEDAAALRRQGT